jgi:MFS family permease
MRAVIGRVWSRLFPNPRYYGWAIVGLGFLGSALSSPGQSFVISLYLDPLMRDLHLSRVAASSLYGTATLAAAACLPFLGGWVDRLPAGRFLGGVLTLLALAIAGLSTVQTALALGVAFYFLRLLGQGAIGLGTVVVTARWFRRYRGRALAVVGLGYAFGQVVFPGLIYGLFARLGWRGSLLALAGVYLLVAAPFMGRLMRDRRPGDDPLDGAETDDDRDAGHEAEPSYSRGEALRMPVFWGMLLCVAIPPMVSTAVIFHQVALFSALGWGATLVPSAFMAYALAAVVTTYGTGLLLERIPSRVGVSLALGLSAAGLATVAVPLPPLTGALLYATLLGMSSGSMAAANPNVWPDYFGVAALGALKGVVIAARNGASALGPIIAALLLATSGSFGGSLVLFGLISAGGSLLALSLGRPGAAHVSPEPARVPAGTDEGRAA